MNTKAQRGDISWIFIIMLFVLSIGFYLVSNYEKEEKIANLRSSPPVISADMAQIIDEYKAKPSPRASLNGMYRGSLHSDGKTLAISYYFGSNNTLTKTAVMEGLEFKGSAKYNLQGSVLVYSKIEGDKGLFFTQGEAFAEKEGNKLFFPSPEQPFELTKAPEQQ